jgi:hypothetical protein
VLAARRRKNCATNDAVFRQAEGDLNNLVPAVGEVNADRSNLSYGAWAKQPTRIYGQCGTVVDFAGKRVQRAEVRACCPHHLVHASALWFEHEPAGPAADVCLGKAISGGQLGNTAQCALSACKGRQLLVSQPERLAELASKSR